MTTDFAIRAAEKKDAQDIVDMVCGLALEERMAEPKFTVADCERDWIDHAVRQMWVAEMAGEVMGFVSCYEGYDLSTATTGMHLGDLFIVPHGRRQGLGKALVRHVGQECVDAGGAWVAWTVMRSNVAAKVFYRKLGASVQTQVQHVALGRLGLKRL